MLGPRDFPANPPVGTRFAPDGHQGWEWDGHTWVALAEEDSCCPPLIPNPPVPPCVVQFDYNRWAARYPEFSTPQQIPGSGVIVGGTLGPISKEQAQELFYDATLYLDNTCDSPVCDASVGGERERLLYMLTAHLGYLYGPRSSQQVGFVTSKSAGPLSVGYSVPGIGANAAWFAQSKYGFAFWQGVAQYRQGPRYRVWPPIRPINGFYGASQGLASRYSGIAGFAERGARGVRR